MPTVSFANVKPGNAPDTQPTASAPLAVTTTGTPLPVAAPMSHNPAPQIQGDTSGTSVPIPYLALTQKTSTVVDEHPEWLGKFVYDKGAALGLPSDPKTYATNLNRVLGKDSLLVLVTGVRVDYEEKTEFGEGIIPTIWKTAKEARESGLEFQERGTLDLLIAFDGDHEQVVLLDGKGFLPARFVARKAGFRNTAGVVIRDSRTWLKGDTCSGWYELAVNKITGKNTYWVPLLKAAGSVPAELREAVRNEFSV